MSRKDRASRARRWSLRGRRGLGGWAVFWVALTLQAQNASNWRVYRAADGLTESLTTAITISPRGNVWVKHGEVDAVSVLDGYGVQHKPAPGERNYRVYESRAGRIWSVYPNGLLEFAGNDWIRHPVTELKAELDANPLRAVRQAPLLPADQDRVLLLLPDRLVEYRALSRELRVLRWARETKLGRFVDLSATFDDGVWITGANGIARLPRPLRQIGPQTVWAEHPIPEALQAHNLQRPFEDDDGGITTVGDSEALNRRVLVHFDGTHWLTRALPNENLRFGWRGTEPGEFWGLTASALTHLQPGREEWEREPVKANQYFDLAVQPRGVFWLATLEGLLRYSPLAWRTPSGATGFDSVVHAALQDRSGDLWFATAAGLLRRENGQWRQYPWPERFEPQFRARDGLLGLPDGRIAVAAAEQLWILRPTTGELTPVPHPAGHRLRKVLGQMPDGALCLQTAEPAATASDYQFELFDGQDFRPWVDAPPPIDLGNELFFLAQSQTGDLWLGGSTGPAVWHDGKWQRFTASDGYGAEGALCWVELGDGRIWCAGLGKIAEYDGKTWTTELGGLDRVSAMIRAYDGSVWVATGSGLYRHHKAAWAWVGEEEGLRSSTCFAVLEDRNRGIWVGTSRGINQYFPRTEVDAPRTRSITVDRLEGGPESVVQLSIRGRDKWQATPDERLLFSHRLDSGNWSAFGRDTTVALRNVSAGKHRFEVRALDRNWNFEPQPAALEFQVVVPWYRDRRVLYVALAGMVAALFFAGLAVNRHGRLRRSYAEVERQVAERTRELEQATQALAHSQKMTALGTLAAGIAHDFNNILSIIRGSAQIIESHLDDRDKVLTRVSRIKTMVDQASGIVRAMLGFGRVGEQRIGPCDPAEVVEETLRMLGDRFLREMPVEPILEPNLPAVRGTRDLMQQALLNLILNAADASGPHGAIQVRVHRLAALPPNPVLVPSPAPEYVAIAVDDNGNGVSPEILPRIFEPFFTTKSFSSRRGTGLGLYMVYEFAKEMGHGIAVESAPGQGSTFTLLLPVA